MNDAVHSFVSTLATGISQARLYTRDHLAVGAAAEKLVSLLDEFPEERISIMVVQGELVINDVLFRKAGLHGEKLVRQLKAKGISRVDFLEGVTAEEVKHFIADVAEAEKDLGQYTRIRAGVMRVRLATPELLANMDFSTFTDEQLTRLQAVYGTVSPFRELEMTGLEEIVANFLVTFRRGANVLRMISPVKSYSSYTYTHAMNVAVLSMSQAEYLGLDDDIVQEIGIAALMHDVGKLFVSKEILENRGALGPEEFAEIKRHPLLGAAYLAKMENIPRLAPIIALEHHRRFDGSGYPVPANTWRRQHAASQIVAIADVYDALRSTRPYRKSLSVEEVLVMIQKGAGKEFNPVLTNNFILMLVESLRSS